MAFRFRPRYHSHRVDGWKCERCGHMWAADTEALDMERKRMRRVMK